MAETQPSTGHTTNKYLRAAFIAFDPGGYPNDDSKKRVIPFRFNPEGLSRSLQVEEAQGGGGAEGAGSGGGDSSTEQSSDASSGTLKHTFSVQVRLDFVDRHQVADGLKPELGILPEICAIEELLYPAEADSQDNASGDEPVQARLPRPTVLFVWGRKRVYPVKITQMTINELTHNAHLNPERAIIEVGLEILGEADAADNQAVTEALGYTAQARRSMAKKFLEKTAEQNTNILPF